MINLSLTNHFFDRFSKQLTSLVAGNLQYKETDRINSVKFSEVSSFVGNLVIPPHSSSKYSTVLLKPNENIILHFRHTVSLQ